MLCFLRTRLTVSRANAMSVPAPLALKAIISLIIRRTCVRPFFGGTYNSILSVKIISPTLSLLFVAGVAAYVRVVTVRITLVNDWISFIPALLFANFIFFLTLYFSHYSIDYLYLFKNSIFTFIFYPILWSGFTLLQHLMKT